MKIEIRPLAFNPWDEVAVYQQLMEQSGRYGACAAFVGSMRDFNQGYNVQDMYLEYYPGMAEQYLEGVCEVARQRWDLVDLVLLHRVGVIEIAESIVLVCVWSAHRAAAFSACNFIVEDLKGKAPFWKQESTVEGKRWVTGNTVS